MQIRLRPLGEASGIPPSDKIIICDYPKDERTLYIIIKRTNGEYKDDAGHKPEITIRVRASVLEKNIKEISSGESVTILGEPITEADEEYSHGIEGRTNKDRLEITTINHKRRWYFDLKLTKRSNQETGIRIAKWTFISILRRALAKKAKGN